MASWKILRMSGEAEPWWFFSDWEKDITEETVYTNEEEAFNQFIKLVEELKNKFQHTKQKKNTVAFWNEDEKVFCEECDDDLQLFHGLLLMEGKDLKPFTEQEKEILTAALEKSSY
ncbi:DUF1033 family protein [Bacillus salacetis]|uniref:DUF1033 family protein n=1 Tax=Bacillus salacetis TaxID=2315464 RepID=UPI003BA3CFC8